MFSSLLKNVHKTYNRSFAIPSIRYLTSYNETKQIDQEEAAAIEIETRLFDNSLAKYEPIKKESILKQQKLRKKESKNMILSSQRQIPSLKKTRSEREAESKLINDPDLGLEFLKLGLNDPILSTLLITVRSKKRRDKDRQIILEGRRLILEALMCGLKLNSVIFSQREELADIKKYVSKAQKQFSTKIYKVPHHDLKTWSTLTTPPGVMAIFERPTLNYKISSSCTPLPITVVCDNIREPNNLGSIIRICAALPCQQVVITRGCCDPWDSKALRSGCGGHFRLPIKDDIEWSDISSIIPPEFVDSCCVFVAENNLNKLHKKTTVAEYSEVEKTGLHNVVIIGGESHGVSQDAYQLMETAGTNGKCLYIPLAQGIDSLNVASAATLILYELRKNILKANKESLLPQANTN